MQIPDDKPVPVPGSFGRCHEDGRIERSGRNEAVPADDIRPCTPVEMQAKGEIQ